MSIPKKWTRRKFIRNSAATAAALPLAAKRLRLRAAEPASCVFNPEQEEGPYYVDRELLRSDITEGRIGVPLRVRVTIVDAKTCAPIPNAALDIWHCDAGGVYSGYTKINSGFGPGGPGGPGGGPGFPSGRPPGAPPNDGPANSPSGGGTSGPVGGEMLPGPPPDGGPDGPGGPPMGGGPGGRGGMPPKPRTTDDLVFLRGVQITDAKGVAEFATIFPGHYPGRVNHIHMKVHVGGGATKAAVTDASHRATEDAAYAGVEVYAGGHVAHTGQLFFPEDVSRFVEATHPYSGNKVRRTILEEDMVFSGQSGAGSVAKLTAITSTQLSDGYVATLTVAVDPGATPELVGIGGPGRPR